MLPIPRLGGAACGVNPGLNAGNIPFRLDQVSDGPNDNFKSEGDGWRM
jgi:hypothetical protein